MLFPQPDFKVDERLCERSLRLWTPVPGNNTEALALAHALFEHEECEHSLTIAEHGLSLEGQKAPLATWLREHAATMGKTDLALRAAEIAYQEEITLENYLRVAAIAGEQ